MTKKASDKVLVIFTQACAPYAKGEIVGLSKDMAQVALNPRNGAPPVAEVYRDKAKGIDGVPLPRDKSRDGESSTETLRARALKAEGALSLALDRVEDLTTKSKKA